MKLFLYLLLHLALIDISPSLAADPQSLVHQLVQQGISEDAMLGFDIHGIPMVCGTTTSVRPPLFQPRTSGGMPPGVQSCECIPNVIQNHSNSWFRVEVDMNGFGYNPHIGDLYGWYFETESGTNYTELHDDGLNGDRVAGDYIFTSERCRYRSEVPLPDYHNFDTNALPGLYINRIGTLYVSDSNGFRAFLIPPAVAVISTNIPIIQPIVLNSNVQLSPHLINVQTSTREVQLSLRTGASATALAQKIYAALPDAFDFLAFFSTDHLEYSPQNASPNFTLGRSYAVSVGYTGTGYPVFSDAAYYGSAGRLKSILFFDTMERGIQRSDNAVHELLHQWCIYVSTTLFITKGDGHYSRDCSVNSILGGHFPITNANGTISRGCFGADSYTEANSLEKYMMGLISTSTIPPFRVSSNSLAIGCNAVITNYRPAPITIADIVAIHGLRTPGPATSQKNFSIAFATASYNRLLTPVEMTFYDLMAGHFTKTVPPGHANPEINRSWVPMTRYIGEGTTWSSEILSVIRPTIQQLNPLPQGKLQISGTGYPGKSYRLLSTTNLVQWTPIATNNTLTNGLILFTNPLTPFLPQSYFRISVP